MKKNNLQLSLFEDNEIYADMKANNWFKHDANAQDDPKIVNLLDDLGMMGYGIFWGLIEKLRSEQGYKLLVQDALRFSRRWGVKKEEISRVIHDFKLFNINGDFFSSERLLFDMELMEEKSVSARESAKKRWESRKFKNANASKNDANASKNDANALPSHENFMQTQCERKDFGCEGNAIRIDKNRIVPEGTRDETIGNILLGKESTGTGDPKSITTVESSKTEEEKTNDKKNESKKTNKIVNPFSENFLSTWDEWKDYKKVEHKFHYKSERSENASLEKLKNLSDGDEEVAKQIIRESIANGWEGFFKLKTNNNAKNSNISSLGSAQGESLFDRGLGKIYQSVYRNGKINSSGKA